MEDLIMPLIFLVFAGLSMIGRAAKRQEGRRTEGQPQWPPKPMEGGGAEQRPRPQPVPQQWPPQPRQQQPPQQWPPAPAPVRSEPPRQSAVRKEPPPREAESTMGEGVSMMAQGPSARDRAREVKQRSVHGQVHNQPAPPPPEPFLADAQSLTQAIVMAEVLGKPKALRGRGRH